MPSYEKDKVSPNLFQCDKDENGHIEFDEFLRILARKNPPSERPLFPGPKEVEIVEKPKENGWCFWFCNPFRASFPCCFFIPDIKPKGCFYCFCCPARTLCGCCFYKDEDNVCCCN